MQTNYNVENAVTDTVKVVLIASALVFLEKAIQINIGLNLADEGYLWYGVTQTLKGDVALRDFSAYDPGRYYWSAFWCLLFGDGIIGIRMGTAIFQAIALCFGLLFLKKRMPFGPLLILAGGIILMWMYPRHKLFDLGASLMGVYFIYSLLEKPTIHRCLVSGIFVGLAAFLGRNHGLYLLLALISALGFLFFAINREDLWKKAVASGIGVFIGYLPMLALILLVPGFWGAFVDSVLYLFQLRQTNLALPVPWPWIADYAGLSLKMKGFYFSQGVFFLLLPLFYSGVLVYCIFFKSINEKSKMLFAACIVGLFYMHHGFSRADISHLAQSIHPFLLAFLLLCAIISFEHKKWSGRWVAAILIGVLLIFSVFAIGIKSPFYNKVLDSGKNYTKTTIRGEDIWIHLRQEDLIRAVQKIAENIVSRDEMILIAPNRPGLYPIIDQASPLRTIFFLFPESESVQTGMVKKLDEKKVNWVILANVAIDGRDDLRFRNTHSIVYDFIIQNYIQVGQHGLPGNYQLYHRPRGK